MSRPPLRLTTPPDPLTPAEERFSRANMDAVHAERSRFAAERTAGRAAHDRLGVARDLEAAIEEIRAHGTGLSVSKLKTLGGRISNCARQIEAARKLPALREADRQAKERRARARKAVEREQERAA